VGLYSNGNVFLKRYDTINYQLSQAEIFQHNPAAFQSEQRTFVCRITDHLLHLANGYFFICTKTCHRAGLSHSN